MGYTGECFVPDLVDNERIKQDHFHRYYFARKFISDKIVLDIACGVGYGANILREEGYKSYIGVDVNQDNIEYAKNNYTFNNTRFLNGDIRDFREDPVDVIICFETIEHISFYKEAIQNLYANLKKGGMLILSSPNRPVSSPAANSILDKPKNKFHTQEFTPAELKKELIYAGFKNKNINIYGQRLRYYLPNKYFLKFYNRLFQPDFKSSPKIKSYCLKKPRYFIITACKY